MNINKMILELMELLSSNKLILNHRLEAERLIENELKVNKAYLLSHSEDFLDLNIVKKIKRQAKKRVDNYPLAYITGHKEFYGLDFFVNKDVLIPRPETELMVDLALARLQTDNYADVLDIGTGSGCIAVSVAQNSRDKNINFFACDISKKALATARKNARKHLVAKKISFFKSDLLKSAISYLLAGKGLIILANLPYLSRKQINISPSIQHEPKIALEANDDGLYLYKKLFIQIKNSLNEKTRIIIYCEFDHTQSGKILKLANKTLPLYKKKIIKDLSGYDRIIEISKGV